MTKERLEWEIRRRGGEYKLPDPPKTNAEKFVASGIKFAEDQVRQVLGMQEYVGDARQPRIRVGIINNTEIDAFVFPLQNGNVFFIGIYLGALLRFYNILFGAIIEESGLLGYCINKEYKPINPKAENLIAPSIHRPGSVALMIRDFERFTRVRCDAYYHELVEDVVTHAAEFLIMHELAHVLRGHFKTLNEHSSRHAFAPIAEREMLSAFALGDEDEGKRLLRGIEADADMQAICMGYNFFDLVISQLSRNEPATLDHILDDTFFRLFAIGALFLLMDDGLPIQQQFEKHPPVYVRLLYIQWYLLNCYKIVSKCPHEKLKNEVITVFSEIENLALLLGAARGRWIRHESPNDKGVALEVQSLIKDNTFIKEDRSVFEIIDLIDQTSEVCFISGVKE